MDWAMDGVRLTPGTTSAAERKSQWKRCWMVPATALPLAYLRSCLFAVTMPAGTGLPIGETTGDAGTEAMAVAAGDDAFDPPRP